MGSKNHDAPILPILPDPATHIRLLTLQASSGVAGNANIQISLTSTLVSNAPSYHAVSYTWGPAAPKEVITICNGKPDDSQHGGDNSTRLTIRKNCADVLRQLAHFKTAQYYWVDALCIDQENDVEKSYQVAMMGLIFSRAECVLSCVGMHEGDSKFMTDTLRDFDVHLSSHERSSAVFSSPNRDWTDEKGWTLWHCEQWLESLGDDDALRLCKAIDVFASRSYFWRIWILQELFLARRIIILCDFDELSLPTLLFWWIDAKTQWFFQHREDIAAGQEPPILFRKLTASQASKDYLRAARWNQVLNFLDEGGSGFGAPFEDMLRERALSFDERPGRERISLSRILTLCENRNCQDPRDTVYGTLSLADWGRGTISTLDGAPIRAAETVDNAIHPDYTKSRYSLAKEIMINFREMGELVKLVLYMLNLGPWDEEVMSGIDARCQQSTSIGPITDQELVQYSNESEQEQMQIVEGGFQITPESIWRIEQSTTGEYVYIKAIDGSGQHHAIASKTTKVNDWIVPTVYSYGFVLRQIGEASKFYQIIGKVFFPPELLPDDLEMTAFMVWLGVDDILVHLAGGLASILSRGRTEQPGEQVLEHINDSVSRGPCSSCAEIPLEKRTHTAEDFVIYSTAITFALIADWNQFMFEKSKQT